MSGDTLFSSPSLLLIATAVTFYILGREASFRLWRRSHAGLEPLERILSAATLGIALWVGSLWALTLAGELTPFALAGRNVAAAVVAAGLWFHRWRHRSGARSGGKMQPALLLAFVPLSLWLVFILWRGMVVPPLSHDALAYHLPKAVFYARAAGYDPLPDMPARARNIPVNYELLLAERLVLDGDDTYTEWLGAIHYLFFIVSGAALASRWWGRDARADAVVAILLAAVPVALLHSGAHKNDLLTAAAITSGLVWLGRFASFGELRSLLLAMMALAMAAGTKPQAAFVVLIAAPWVLLRLGARPKPLQGFAGVTAAGLLFLALLGGAYWPLDRAATSSAGGGGVRLPAAYGDWENLWQVPYVLLVAPFSRSATALNVPWSDEPWFWRRYEIYFSELGVPFALSALLLPIAIWRYRRLAADRLAERRLISIVTGVTFLALMPVIFRPHGFYAISAPRYVLFAVPVVFAWTVAPFVRSLRRPWLPMLIASGIFIWYAALAARNDSFVPLRYAMWAARNEGTRVIPFDPNRAASLLDRVAPADAKVSIEAADGTWLYPAFGRELSRQVELVPFGSLPRSAESEWFVIDRKFETIWKHPAFAQLGQTSTYIGRGGRELEDDPLVRTLIADPQWRLVYRHSRNRQAIFSREVDCSSPLASEPARPPLQ